MSSKHKIEFTVTCTPKEHEKAWMMVQRRCGFLRFWWIVLLTSLVFVAAAVNILIQDALLQPLLWGCAFCAAAILLPIVYLITAILYVNKRRRHYLEKYMAIGERELTVFSHSVSISSMLVSTDIPFSDCKYFLKTKNFFLLIQNRRGYLIIPKRDIPQGELKELKKRMRHASRAYRLLHRGKYARG